jgi:hypothetical protein
MEKGLMGSERAGLLACTGTGGSVLGDLDDGGAYLIDFRTRWRWLSKPSATRNKVPAPGMDQPLGV